jgi:hypothetical protein
MPPVARPAGLCNAGPMLKLVLMVVLMVPLALEAQAAKSFEFRSPSGNIVCVSYLDDNDVHMVRCDIIERADAAPLMPMPADCDADWGNMFILSDKGAAGLECAGDLAANPKSAGVLEYGSNMKRYDVTCVSETSGMTCTNADGHGFFLSKARQELF